MAGRRRIDKILVSGITLLAIGVVLLASSAAALLGPAVTNRGTFVQIHLNEYASPNITLNDNSALYVLNVTKNFSLVPSADIGKVNSSNIATYAIAPVPGGSINLGGTVLYSGDNSTLYGNIAGQYSIVSFSGSVPKITYIVEHSTVSLFANLGIAGGVMAIFSIPAIVIGALRQVRIMKNEKDIEDLLNM